MADTIAAQALGWLAGDADLLANFMGTTGVGADDLRARAGEAQFLCSVLDFLMMDDAWIVGFCDHARLPYDAPMRAQAALSGGGHMHWT